MWKVICSLGLVCDFQKWRVVLMLMKENGIYLQGPLQLSSQLSGGAQELSNEDSGGGDVKSDSTSWKSCQLDVIEGKESGRSIQHTVKQDNNGQQIKR
jgi:hypothetical protein